ncbi:E3 ubiquitin-protein ligase RNF186 [Fundulus heteroclitus]|uniref:E3 ubiquitin-protein ligase RNF186 n=1 Tax=Fundulus heteroclitus TaxID=8078 RepID=UPI00165AD4EE|nr:E3 ubiquitin-protein ligase RNF186 [Fundulus heteroclitus]
MAENGHEQDCSGCAQSNEEDFECKICYNHFDLDRRVPKQLSCSHTFCRECLETLHSREGRGWRIGCPVCRRRTPVRDYQVQNLPNDSALFEALPLGKHRSSSNEEEQQAAGSSESPAGGEQRCETCKNAAFATGCVCAIFSFFSMVVLLFLGLIFVHNFNHAASPVGPACLFAASVLALLSVILTWLLCMLKYGAETEASTLVLSHM